MDCDEYNKELWGWQEDNILQRDSRNDMSNCLWDEVNNDEDGLLYMLGEHTPIKDCTDFDYLISGSGEKGKEGVEESVESSQQKRRRMLQFNSDDADSISMELSSVFIKSKIGDPFVGDKVNNEKMQWVSGFLDCQEELDLDQPSEHWLASCFNENEIHISSEEMNISGNTDDSADISDQRNVTLHKEAVRAPAIVTVTPSSKFKGRKSYIRTPTKMTSSVAYPFELIKPCGVQGDVTLKDINQRIHAPVLLKIEDSENDNSLESYPTSAFSGKPVVVKTKIRTEGGKGSITIMRTRG